VKTTLLAILAFAPIGVIVLASLSVMGIVDPAWADILLETRGFLNPVAIFCFLALLVYLIDIWRNPRVPAEKRALWTVVLFAANWYALPFYFWFYVRKA